MYRLLLFIFYNSMIRVLILISLFIDIGGAGNYDSLISNLERRRGRSVGVLRIQSKAAAV